MKVLITDDSATMRGVVREMLGQLGISDCLEASDGLEALAAMESHPVDLVLLDLHMPNMDGLECAKRIRGDPRTSAVPLVMISSDTETGGVDEAYLLGIRTYVAKPFRLERLREAVNKALTEAGVGPAADLIVVEPSDEGDGDPEAAGAGVAGITASER
jgi:CheY-like chemotaxis protein